MTSRFYICKQILANRKVPLEYGVPLTAFFPSKGVFGGNHWEQGPNRDGL
jgi:hypothetical protein